MTSHEIITRQEAKERGLKRYFTGKPCKHGHVCERLMTKNCVVCHKEGNARHVAKYRNKNIEKHRQSSRHHSSLKYQLIRAMKRAGEIEECHKKKSSNERISAQIRNEKYYFTGIPCKNGHISNRYVSSNGCVICQRIISNPKLKTNDK